MTINPRTAKISLATAAAIMAALLVGAWRVSAWMTTTDYRMANVEQSLEPLPQMQQDIATLLERTAPRSTASAPPSDQALTTRN